MKITSHFVPYAYSLIFVSIFRNEIKQVFVAAAQLHCSFRMISSDRVAFTATITQHTQVHAHAGASYTRGQTRTHTLMPRQWPANPRF